MKRKIKKFDIGHWVKIGVSLALAVGISYFVILVYIHYSNAGVLKLSNYLGRDTEETDVKSGYPVCPKLMKVEGKSGAIIIRDECTNLYWNRLDLPLENDSGDREGYTWQEAKQYCEDLATVDTGDGNTRSLFRLPTADELLSLTYTPCVGCASTSSASPITDISATYLKPDGTTEAILPTPSGQYFYKTGGINGIKFAEGAYWTKDELDMNGDLTNYEAASSVNLYYGTVNNPVFSKKVKLNVRCIFDNPDNVGSRETVKSTNYNINELQWLSQVGTDLDGGMKLKLGIRKNLTPIDGIDVNKCPEGYNDELTGNFALCTGVTAPTYQYQYFACPGVKKYVKNSGYVSGVDSPIQCKE